MHAYEDLSDEQFENLIVILCQFLFGIAVQGFAKGPDGGRDAKFVGTAEHFPNKSEPWRGTIIIQAKHTNGHNKSFSESDFFSKSSKNNVIEKEIPRIINMVNKNQLNHYILFSNRRLTGNTNDKIITYISQTCNIPLSSIFLCGVEQLNLWLKHFPRVAELAKLDPIDSPLLVSSDELAEVVEALARQMNIIGNVSDIPPTKRTSYENKNKINDMTSDYAQFMLKYLKDTVEIQTFLAAPENDKFLQLYEGVAEDFHFKIISKRKNYQSFDEILEYLYDLLISRDPVLKQHKNKRLTRAVLFYMYWNCDIGMT
ncbi:ABC-three component system protein [Xenorhabdus budapestensis]|uniref:ABC-three component system protein n=1 Tax=Xenorhabdus budapestensis TaxID=290110 RepID=UPI003A857915